GLRAVDEPEELVASELRVGAEDEERLRAGQPLDAVEAAGRGLDVGPGTERQLRRLVERLLREDVVRAVPEQVGSDRRAAEGEEEEEDDEHPAADYHLVAAEAAPDLLPVAARANRFDLAELPAELGGDRAGESRLGSEDFAILALGAHRWRNISDRRSGRRIVRRS